MGLEILKKLIKKVKKYKGGILFIDYGYLQSKGIDTLQSVMSHKKNKYFNNIGKADITYLVNFQLLKKFIESNSLFLNEIVEQSFFF